MLDLAAGSPRTRSLVEIAVSSGSKTVFVLGAGFSRFAGFPLQAEILERVPQLSLMDAPSDTVESYVETLEAVNDFRSAIFPA